MCMQLSSQMRKGVFSVQENALQSKISGSEGIYVLNIPYIYRRILLLLKDLKALHEVVVDVETA